ncbi:FecR family protein [Sphingomonas colocasiae]|uniref:FecR domain-containing protein n=1 Tax=Sphingomonas colocasiae TaxID=1848973 RepID=A0ABS7PNL6_9SPHN|nr:FecR domain-containing protein [Sphingomonas colocasiae]MBY8822912.1 FecR domain-containing protein [Sphingomonas colocasiae]
MIGPGRVGADGGMPGAEDSALYWLARQRLKLMTKRDEAAFEAWLSDPANAQAYRDAAAGVERFGAIASDEDVREMREAALAMGPAPRRISVPFGLVAATAAIAMGAGVWFAVARPGSDMPAPASIAAGGAPPPIAATARRYATKIGERSRFTLDDGSVVSLNTNSVLDVTFTPGRRDVRLIQGEGLFHVAKNKDRPFVVTAGGLRTTAIGTAFDVRLDRGRVRIVLTSGRVVVDSVRSGPAGRLPAIDPISLQPGEQLAADENHAVVVSAADVEQATSWRQGQLIFRDEPLASAIGEMNRYTRDQIVIEDPKIARLRVSGVFSTAHPENFLAAMTAFYPLEVRRPTQGAVILDWSGAPSDP